MAPQVASLSELSRIRGDAEVRYPYAITEPKLSPPGLDRPRDGGGGGRKMRGLEGRGLIIFFSEGTERKRGEQLESEEGGKKREQWKEREWERDIREKRRDRPQQGDELLVKWLLFSSRASQLPFLAPVSVSHKVI